MKLGNSHAQELVAKATQPEVIEPNIESSETPVDSAIVSEAGGLYQRAIELIRSDFETSTWQAFLQVAVEGRSPKDAASDLGLSINAVYISKSRVLRRLREELGDDFQ